MPKEIRGLLARARERGVGDALAFLSDVDETSTSDAERLLGNPWPQNSPVLDIAEPSARAGAPVVAADPRAVGSALTRVEKVGLRGFLTVTDVHLGAGRYSDAIVVATDWVAFSGQDPTETGQLTHCRLVIDG